MKRKRPLPPLQFQIITIIGAREKAGREIRDALRKRGVQQSLASFYMLMKRMKDVGLVKRRSEQLFVKGHAATQSYYKVTGKGNTAFEATREWYGVQLPLEPGLGW